MIGPSVRRPLLADAVFSRTMDALTGGTFLAGLAVHLDASNFGLAALAALPFLAQIAQLPTVALLLRWKNRRRIVVLAASASRVLLLAIAAALLLAPAWLTADSLLVILGAAAVLTVVATAAWNWWLRDLLPPDELGRIFGQRMTLATWVGLAVMLLAGGTLDRFAGAGNAGDGYALLFGLGGVAGLAGVVVLSRTPHVDPPPSPPARASLALVKQAVRECPPSLLPALALTGIAVVFALPFTAVFLLRSLGYSYAVVTFMAVTSMVAYVGGLRGWAYLSDRYGDRGLLAISMSVLGFCLVGWAGAGWAKGPFLFGWLLVLHFLAGYGMGGLELATTNLMLRTAPVHNGAAHLAAVSLVRAGAAGVGILIAGGAWQAMGRGVLWSAELPMVGVWELRGFQVLCLAAVLLSLAAAVALRRMPAPAGSRMPDVARAMRREIHQMSSIAGMRGVAHAVSYYVELMAWPFAARKRRRPTAASARQAAFEARGEKETEI